MIRGTPCKWRVILNFLANKLFFFFEHIFGHPVFQSNWRQVRTRTLRDRKLPPIPEEQTQGDKGIVTYSSSRNGPFLSNSSKACVTHLLATV